MTENIKTIVFRQFALAILNNTNENLLFSYIELGDLGGPFDFTDCLFVGVDHGIHRNGDATMFTSNDIVQFNSEFKMNDIGINCTWHYRVLYLYISIYVFR